MNYLTWKDVATMQRKDIFSRPKIWSHVNCDQWVCNHDATLQSYSRWNSTAGIHRTTYTHIYHHSTQPFAGFMYFSPPMSLVHGCDSRTRTIKQVTHCSCSPFVPAQCTRTCNWKIERSHPRTSHGDRYMDSSLHCRFDWPRHSLIENSRKIHLP